MVAHVDVEIKPSVDCRSHHHNSTKFKHLMNALGFSDVIRLNVAVAVKLSQEQQKAASALNWAYTWAGKNESSSYEPLQQFLMTKNIVSHVIGNGNGLSGGLLYDVEIFSLKPNTSYSSDYFRKTNQEPRSLFTLKGKTDLVVLTETGDTLVNRNIKYFIEIKTVKDFKDESLREAVLQLIGGNVGALYRSPPVFLTNLVKSHYVVHIDRIGNPKTKLEFELKILKMNSLGHALLFLEEHTKIGGSVTRDFARLPTPRTSTTATSNSESWDSVELGDEDDNAIDNVEEGFEVSDVLERNQES